MSSSDAQRLQETLGAHRVVVVCGTGGVGKTTLSAALALDAALTGRRALVLTIDPARRLADALGVSGRLNEVTEIDVEGLLGRPLPPGGSLSAMMLDAKATFDGIVQRFAPSPAVEQRILANRYYQRASESLSGSQEYMAMEKLLEVQRGGDFDLVVLDTPPSRNALDFLEAPKRMMSMLSEGGLKWLRRNDGGNFSSSRAGAAVFGKARQAMFGVFERFTGGEVLSGISEFVTLFAALLEGMGTRAGQVLELLRSDQTAFLMVASPTRLALSEGLYFHDRLVEAEIPFFGFILNRVRPPGPDLEAPDEPGELFPENPGEPGWDDCIEAVWSQYLQHLRWADVDRHHIDALKQHCGESPFYLEIPELQGPVHDLEALDRLLPHLRQRPGDGPD